MGGKPSVKKAPTAKVPGYSAQEMAQLQQFEAAMDTRVPCKHCGRKFNETAAERHIPVCANKAK